MILFTLSILKSEEIIKLASLLIIGLNSFERAVRPPPMRGEIGTSEGALGSV